MFERFTDEARQVVVRAQAEARGLRAARIEPVHLLLAVAGIGGRGGAVLHAAGVDSSRLRTAVTACTDPLDADALAALGVDLDQVRATVEATFGPGALELSRQESGSHLPFTEGSKRALEQSLRQLLGRRPRRRSRTIDSGHVLSGVLAVADPVVGQVLQLLQADEADLRRRAGGAPEVA